MKKRTLTSSESRDDVVAAAAAAAGDTGVDDVVLNMINQSIIN